MNVPFDNEDSARRFAPYVTELQELFAVRNIPCGSPADLAPIAQSVAVPGSLHDDATSIIRSILYREHEAISQTMLLQIVVMAAAGPAVEEGSQEVQEAIHRLDDYVGEVVQSLSRKPFLEDSAESEIEPVEVMGGAEAPPIETVPATSSEETLLKASDSPVESSSEALPIIEPLHSNPVVTAEPPRDRGPAVTYAEVPVPVLPVEGRLDLVPASPLVPAAIRHTPSTGRFRWIAGACVFLLVLFAGLVWGFRSKKQGSHAPSANDPVASLTPQVQPAPMADKPAANTGNISAIKATSPAPKPSAASPASNPRALFQDNATTPKGGTELNASAPAAVTQTPASNSKATSGPPRRSPRSRVAPPPVPSPQQSPQPGSFLVSSGVMAANLITNPVTPKYPKWANMAGIQGQVILQAVVSRNGTVVATHVLDGHRLLRSAATHAVRSWRYRPYLVNGKPADVSTIVIVDFHLHP